MKSEKHLSGFAEMAIREILTHARFADLLYQRIRTSSGASLEWIYIVLQALVSHTTIISLLLKSRPSEAEQTIGGMLGVSPQAIVHQRGVRNSIHHYDERLRSFLKEHGNNLMIADFNVGPKDAFRGMMFIRHFDPGRGVFSMFEDEIEIDELAKSVRALRDQAAKLLQDHGVK
jgi:hypothetical protein